MKMKQRIKKLTKEIKSGNYLGSNREKFNIANIQNGQFHSTKNYFALWVHLYYFCRSPEQKPC